MNGTYNNASDRRSHISAQILVTKCQLPITKQCISKQRGRLYDWAMCTSVYHVLTMGNWYFGLVTQQWWICALAYYHRDNINEWVAHTGFVGQSRIYIGNLRVHSFS